MASRLGDEPRRWSRPKSHALLDGFPEFAVDLEVAAGLSLTSDQFYELSEVEQDLQRARWERKTSRCQHCGLLVTECSDAQATFYPQRIVCFPTMEARAAERRYEALHEKEPFHDGTFKDWVAKADAAHPYHFEDGVTIWASPVDLAPDDDFLQRKGGDDDD